MKFKRCFTFIIAIIAYTCLVFSQKAEQYLPFIEDGKEWHADVENSVGEQWKQLYFLDGDTIIAGQTYVKMMIQTKSSDGSVSVPSLFVALCEEGSRVTFLNPGAVEPRVLYDFGAEPGDKVNVYEVHSNPNHEDVAQAAKVIYKKDLPYGNRMVNTLYVSFADDDISDWQKEGCWIEGVGTINGPLSYMFGIFGNHTTRMVCTVEGDTIFDSSQFSDRIFRRMKDVEDNKDIIPQPFLAEGKQWLVGEWKYGNDHFTSLSTYYVDGKETVDGEVWTRLMCRKEEEGGRVTDSLAAFLHETNRQVWRYIPETGSRMLIYDFGRFFGDTLTVCAGLDDASLERTCIMTVSRSSNYTHDGIQYRSFLATTDGEGHLWTEGIGAWGSPLNNRPIAHFAGQNCS